MGFFDSIADAFESALTPAGTNARRSQEADIRGMSKEALALFRLLAPMVRRQMQFRQSMQGVQDAALTTGLSGTGPGARDARIDRYGEQVDDATLKAMKRAALIAKQQGLGDGGLFADIGNIEQQGAIAKNQYAAEQFSPEGYGRDAAAVFDLFQRHGANQSDLAQLFSLFGGIVNGQQPVQVQPGIGQVLGQIAGDYASKRM
jgi:hypothetical protein